MLIRKYHEQLSANESDILDKGDKFLEKHEPPELTQEEMENQ